MPPRWQAFCVLATESSPLPGVSRRGNGTWALAFRCSVLVNTTSLYRLKETSEHQGKGEHLVPKFPQGINTTCTQLVVHWYCDTIVGFLRSSVKVVQLWCFWVNSPLFECTWKQQQQQQQQQKTPHLKKKKQQQQLTPVRQEEVWVSTLTFTGDSYVQGSASFLILVTDDNVNGKWRPEKSAGMEWEGLILPYQKPLEECSDSSGWTPTHLFKRLLYYSVKIRSRMLNFRLNLWNNKKTKAYFSERSRFMWLSLLFQAFFLRDRGLLCSSG